MMVARTLEIDDAVRRARTPQVVILGAGLDGRAWRMVELEDSVVFEVDHPASQREKRARSDRLKPTARDIRFVPVDFAHDDLAGALSAAGHDPTRPTTWIWEGVVMYLERPAIEATLRVVHARSSLGSRLIFDPVQGHARDHDVRAARPKLETLDSSVVDRSWRADERALRELDHALRAIDAGVRRAAALEQLPSITASPHPRSGPSSRHTSLVVASGR